MINMNHIIRIKVTKFELLERLRQVEETMLVELLGITSDDIVDAFLDLIETRYEYLYEQLREPQEEAD